MISLDKKISPCQKDTNTNDYKMLHDLVTTINSFLDCL